MNALAHDFHMRKTKENKDKLYKKLREREREREREQKNNHCHEKERERERKSIANKKNFIIIYDQIYIRKGANLSLG